MTPKEIRKWFKTQQKECESCCMEWRYIDYPKTRERELLGWIDFEQLEAFTDFFGILDDYTCPAIIVSDGICFKLKDVASGYGFQMTDILKDNDQ